MAIVNDGLTEGEIQDALREEMRKLHAYAMECRPAADEFTIQDYASAQNPRIQYGAAAHELDAMLRAGRVAVRKTNRFKFYKFSAQ